MRILVIGGNGFIGSPLVRELRDSGHEVTVFHRRSDAGLVCSGVEQIQGDRNRLPDYRNQLRRFAPELIVDLILSSGEQARELVRTLDDVARRVVAISSMDVYRAWGVLHGVEPGPLEPLPLTRMWICSGNTCGEKDLIQRVRETPPGASGISTCQTRMATSCRLPGRSSS